MSDPEPGTAHAPPTPGRGSVEQSPSQLGAAGAPRSAKAAAGGDLVVGPATDDDVTVVSSKPPFGVDDDYRGLLPAELGKVLVGRQLGHFRLETLIGHGGMGAVFRGVDTTLSRTVAIKVLCAGSSTEDDLAQRFRNEAQSAARLDHNNIARVYYVGQDHGVQYIAFEHVEGTNIRDLVAQRGPLPLAEAINYTLQVADALTHANRRNVVHRDIKPSNVVITPEGHAKLVDMGLARLRQVDHPQQDLTASGVTLGTFDYISPEQARDPRSADVRSDIYSLGCSLFFMLTGQPPFPKGTVLQKLLQHQGDDAPDPRCLRPELPADTSVITGRMLAKSPGDRYQDPAALKRDLIHLAHRIGMPTAPMAGSPLAWPRQGDPRSLWRRHLPWVAPTVLLIASVALLNWLPPRGGFAPVVPPGSDRVVRSSEQGQPGSARLTEVPVAQSHEHSQANSAPARSPQPTATQSSATQSTAEVRAPTSEIERAPKVTTSAVTKGVRERRTAAAGLVAGSARRPPGGSGIAGPRAPAQAAPPEAAAGATRLSGPKDIAPTVTTDDLATRRQATDDRIHPTPVGTIVVAPESPSAGAAVYPTLATAAQAARTGDVIELRFDGTERVGPLKLAGKRLTLRAGKGRTPHLTFLVGRNDASPSDTRQSMITLVGGDLALVGVHLEMVVPRGVTPGGLSMFDTRGSGTVKLERCWLTIRNEAHDPDVAFLRVGAPTAGKSPREDVLEDAFRPVEIRIESCIARGDATFLASGDTQSVQLFWKNGLLVTSARLLELAWESTSRDDTSAVQIDLQHLTAHVGQGLVGIRNRAGTSTMPVRIACSDSILLGSRDAVLCELTGLERPDRLDQLLIWLGDRNFYEGFSIFWLMDGGPDQPPWQMGFGQWQQYWHESTEGHENLPRYGAVVWKRRPLLDAPCHNQTAADYALAAPAIDNPARGAASDGTDVGFLGGLSLPSSVRAETVEPETAVPATPMLMPGPR